MTARIRFLVLLIVSIVLPTGVTAYYYQQRLQDVNNQVSQLQDKVSQLKAQVDRLNRTSALTPGLPDYLNVCVSGSGQAYHAHAHLSISINGAQQTIPGDVGRNGGCLRPLHTHATDGVIHIEPDSDRTFKLGDFFLVWNQPFNATQFMSQKYTAGQLTMTVNGISDQLLQNYVFPRNAQFLPNEPCSLTPCQNVDLAITLNSNQPSY